MGIFWLFMKVFSPEHDSVHFDKCKDTRALLEACNPYLECNPIKGASPWTTLRKWTAGSSDTYLPVANPYLYNQQQHGSDRLMSFLIICVVTGGWMMGEKVNKKTLWHEAIIL
jgi:hypothetical protein